MVPGQFPCRVSFARGHLKKTNISLGMPPKWTALVRPTTLLAEDDPNGTYYRDPNAAYFPSYPMEPVVRSIFEAQVNSRVDPTKVDICGCGSTHGNLLRFVRTVDTEKPFQFLVEVVGKSVILQSERKLAERSDHACSRLWT
jgi:hypothetical protein